MLLLIHFPELDILIPNNTVPCRLHLQEVIISRKQLVLEPPPVLTGVSLLPFEGIPDHPPYHFEETTSIIAVLSQPVYFENP